MALAARQGGCVSRAQLTALGLTPDAIKHALRRGWLTRAHRGVFKVTLSTLPFLQPEWAAHLATTGTLANDSAGAIHRIRPKPHAVHVIVPRNRRSQPGLHIHRAQLQPHEVTTVNGLPVTTPRRTLQDLRRTLSLNDYARARNEAEVLGLVAAPDEGPTLTRSEAERLLLRIIESAGLPRPQTNQRIGRWEVDALYPEHRLAIEIDGFRYHSTRASFERDRRKDAELTALGYRVLRFTYRQLADEPLYVAATIAPTLRPL